MKTFIASLAVFAASASAGVLDARATCNADNCARSVTGTAMTKPPVTSRFQDCQSYFRTTVTPVTFTPTVLTATTTTSTTATVTVGATTVTVTVLYTNNVVSKRAALPSAGLHFPVVDGILKRTATVASPVTMTASNIPTYASPCSGAVRYSSACSCFGATSSTTFAPAPTAPAVTQYTTTIVVPTDTTTNVPTAYATVTACSPDNEFDYKYDSSRAMGAQLNAEQIGDKTISRYDCCASCYVEDAPAECVGTLYNRNNVCLRYYVAPVMDGSTPIDATPTCPDGRANIIDRAGNMISLAQCGATRPERSAT